MGSTGGAGAAASMGGSGDAGASVDAGEAGELGADDGGGAEAFDDVCEEFVSGEAGVDDVLLHAVHQTTKLRSNVDVSTFLVRIETSFIGV